MIEDIPEWWGVVWQPIASAAALEISDGKIRMSRGGVVRRTQGPTTVYYVVGKLLCGKGHQGFGLVPPHVSGAADGHATFRIREGWKV